MTPKQYTCEYCGKTFPDTGYKEKRRFCSPSCKKLGQCKPRSNCIVCSKPLPRSSGKYCSRKCYNVQRPRDPKKKGVFTCEWCRAKFQGWKSRPNRFCSSQCRSEFGARQSKNWKPEIHITKTCAYCGKEYQTTTHQVRLRGSRFCSIKCRGAMVSIEKRGENNPLWRGGTLDPSTYGSNWGRQKRQAKKRDKHTCQICGYKPGGKRALDVHHIKPLKEFNGDWQAANQLDNLICLCRSCHLKVDYGSLNLIQAILLGKGLV